MGLLMKLFGQESRVRFEGITEDGRKFSGKVTVETIGYTVEMLEKKIKDIVLVEYGEVVKEVKIVAIV